MKIKEVTIDKRKSLSIPDTLCKEAGFKDHEKVLLIAKDQEIIIQKVSTTNHTKKIKKQDPFFASLYALWDNEYDARWDSV